MKRIFDTLMLLVPTRLVEILARLWLKSLGRRGSTEAVFAHLFRIERALDYAVDANATRHGKGIHPKHHLIQYHDFFVDRLAKGERVVDIGCGPGAVAFDMADRAGAIVTAIDLDAAQLETARRIHSHANLTFLEQDALVWEPVESFQTVVMSNVLEHIEDRIGFIRRVQGLLRAERWLIRVPRYDREWQVPMKEELGLPYFLDDTHYIEHTPEKFQSEMAEAGMVVTEMQLPWGEIWAVVTPVEKGLESTTP